MAISPDKSECVGGVVVWDVKEQEIVEQHVVRQPLRFPYVPGLLSFREGPVVMAALRKVRCSPDAFLFDGQGLAHPRRFGLACHMGVLIDRPSLGCAKSLLIGEHETLDEHAGSTARLIHKGDCIGMAVRTREKVKPMYISVGHRLSLSEAVRITLLACSGFRMPEPTRLADKLVSKSRAEGI